MRGSTEQRHRPTAHAAADRTRRLRAAWSLAGALLAAAPAFLAAQTSPADPADPRFRPVVDSILSYIRQGDFPSAAVAVAQDGRIVFERGFGWADRERRIRADEHTMYSLASISKPMTATALMTLVEAGSIDLDAPVNRYLGNARLTGLAGDAERATVRHVLSHTAGLPLHYEFFYADEDHVERPMDAAIARYGILVNPPGEVYQYSNLGYGILDEVVARVSGMRYGTFMRERVFLPLDMTRTSVHLAPGLEPWAAQRYWPDGSVIPFYDFDHDGGSAIWSSAHDLVRFGMFHIDTPLDEQREILGRALRRAMQDPGGDGTGYALGWGVARDHGHLRVAHTGGMPGVSTVLNLYPEENVAVVVLTNQSNTRVGRIAQDLAAAVMPAYAQRVAEQRAAAATRTANGSGSAPALFEPPGNLIGTWTGTLRTYEGSVPLTLVVQPDGDIHARIDGQLTTLLNGTTFDRASGQLTGRFVGTVPTEDARRHAHTVLLNVHLRGDRISGQASAQTAGDIPYYFALTSYVELRRVAR